MLKKKHRLAKTNAVLSALKTGRGFFNPEFTLRHLPKASGETRLTVVVSTKVDKRAVKRNRLKRLVREFARINFSRLSIGDYVIMLKPLAAKNEEKNFLMNLGNSFRKWKLLK